MPTGLKDQKRSADEIGNTVKTAQIATGEEEDAVEAPPKDEAAVPTGWRGEKAHAKKLTQGQRSAIARKAAAMRWDEKKLYAGLSAILIGSTTDSFSSSVAQLVAQTAHMVCQSMSDPTNRRSAALFTH